MWFRSLIFALGYALIILFVTAAGTFAGAFIPYKTRFFVPKMVFCWASFWIRVTCGVKYSIAGLENMPQTGSFIIVSNHQSAWETYALQTLAVPVCTILKRELLWIPFFGWSLAFMRPIAIDRSNAVSASRKVLTSGAQRLKSGISVLIFPEGTRVKFGEFKEFKKSAAVLAAKSGAPIVPIAHNAGKCWAAREFMKKSGLIQMKILEPIETAGKTAEEIHEEYSSRIRTAMREIG